MRDAKGRELLHLVYVDLLAHAGARYLQRPYGPPATDASFQVGRKSEDERKNRQVYFKRIVDKT